MWIKLVFGWKYYGSIRNMVLDGIGWMSRCRISDSIWHDGLLREFLRTNIGSMIFCGVLFMKISKPKIRRWTNACLIWRRHTWRRVERGLKTQFFHEILNVEPLLNIFLRKKSTCCCTKHRRECALSSENCWLVKSRWVPFNVEYPRVGQINQWTSVTQHAIILSTNSKAPS